MPPGADAGAESDGASWSWPTASGRVSAGGLEPRLSLGHPVMGKSNDVQLAAAPPNHGCPVGHAGHRAPGMLTVITLPGNSPASLPRPRRSLDRRPIRRCFGRAAPGHLRGQSTRSRALLPSCASPRIGPALHPGAPDRRRNQDYQGPPHHAPPCASAPAFTAATILPLSSSPPGQRMPDVRTRPHLQLWARSHSRSRVWRVCGLWFCRA